MSASPEVHLAADSTSQAESCDPVWVRLAIWLGVAGYSLLFAYDLWADFDNHLARAEQLVTWSVGVLGLVLVRRRPKVAVFLVLGAIWSQLILSIVHWGYFGAGALVALPALVVAAGMLLGTRGAMVMAAVSCVALPIAYVLPGALLRGGQRLDFKSHGSLVIVSELAFIVTAVLVRAIILSHHRALERAERDRHRYGELFALAPDGLLELDGQGVVQDVNAVALRLLGADRLAVVGEKLDWLLRRADATQVVDLAAVQPGTPVEIVIRASSDAPRSLEISVRHRLGSEARTLLIVRDVTARRQLDERLAHTQRMETVGRLAGGVAHDFNNLLTVVGGNAGLLGQHPDPEVREMVAEIAEAQRRGVALTRQLLAFARRDVRRPEVIELGTAVAGMARLIGRLLGEQHRLELQLDPAPPVLIDRGQIEQVVLNLTGNARDAMAGGGTVKVRCTGLDRAAAVVLGSALGAARQTLLEVADTGTGMTPEVQKRLFEPFFTTKPRGRGTGLGLAMVHGIVLQSEGAVHVRSVLGHGTVVRVFLPASTVAAEGGQPEPLRYALPPGGAEHILLVEDEVSVRRFVERALVDGGYRVTNANESTAAFAIFATAQPPIDLVLTDIVMPGVSGLELAARLVELHGEVPVLFMSGHFEVGKYDRALDPERDLLVKPFTAVELLQRVRERLQTEAAGGQLGVGGAGAS
ncbi:MAG: response regulator [Opitutaceae bacterium]|nr:response regulator [Opitutaceae bacterium]